MVFVKFILKVSKMLVFGKFQKKGKFYKKKTHNNPKMLFSRTRRRFVVLI